MTTPTRGPSEPNLFVVDSLVKALRRLMPAAWRRTLRIWFLGITPDVPVALGEFPSQRDPRTALGWGIVGGLVFCLGGVTLATLASGTFVGDEKNRLYFARDLPNLFNYIVICPAYIGFCLGAVTLVMQSWQRLYARRQSGWSVGLRGRRRVPLGLITMLILGVSMALTVQYIRECLDPDVYVHTPWYVASVTADGKRVLGAAGAYYVLLNFSLLVIALCGLVCVWGVLAIGADVAHALRSDAVGKELSFEELAAGLQEFTRAYLYLKLATVAFMLNAYTWRWERPDGSLNFVLMAAVLSTIGVFVVAFPRYYVELEWYYYKVRHSERQGLPMPRHADDLRDRWIRTSAYVLDLGFGVGFVWSFWR